MPIYEYKCKTCGVVKEKIQKISDPKDSFPCEESDFGVPYPIVCGGTMHYVPSAIGNFTMQKSKVFL